MGKWKLWLGGMAAASVQHDGLFDRVQKEDAAIRLLRTSLAAPDADVAKIRLDAQVLFGEMLGTKMLDELVLNATLVSSFCVNGTEAVVEQQSQIPMNAERHASRVEAAVSDYDCMEREFDVSNPLFDPSEAAKVFSKCRLLVLRNVWSEDLIVEFKANFSEYLTSLHYGKVRPKGRTTLGEDHFIAPRNPKRFDVLFPKYLKHDQIHINSKVAKIMSDPKVLGKDFIVNSMGAVIAESGAPAGSYHYDDAYLLDSDSFRQFSLAGADLPPWAVTMFFPLLNVTQDHGPTEFCMGTTHFKGLLENYTVDESLLDESVNFDKLLHFENVHKSCPKKYRRTPILNMGDAMFFDYTITHRGGANKSPDLRAMPYTFYSRYWYRDSNFEPSGDDLTYEEQRTVTTRFALVSERDDCVTSFCPDQVPLESIRNFMKPKERFQIRNEDLDSGMLYVGKSYLKDLKIGQTLRVELDVGTTLNLYNEDDTLLKKWKVRAKQKTIVLRAQDFVETG